MISMLEIARRTQEGPKTTDRDWEMGLFKKIEELAKKYEIRYPGEGSWFNHDEGLVERAFRAALDFIVERGFLCVSTGRILQFTEEEVRTALRESPSSVVMGEGRDQRVFKQRRIEGKEPLNFCPGHHTPFTEDIPGQGLSVRSGVALVGATHASPLHRRRVMPAGENAMVNNCGLPI